MKCAICCKKFFKPKTQEELEKIIEENIENYDYDEVMKFEDFLITSKHNTTHSCSTPNCECLICRGCWIRITPNGKSIDQMIENDMPSIYNYFKCPFCKQINWKNYMNNVNK